MTIPEGWRLEQVAARWRPTTFSAARSTASRPKPSVMRNWPPPSTRPRST
ncbi:MAG: hypothetical protein R2854_00555 [Caldilineaceae bacterium]